MPKAGPLPDCSVLDDFFDYNPETGYLTWKNSLSLKPHEFVGTEVGTVLNTGYRQVCLNYKRYLVHRLIWKIYYREEPPPILDHIDGDRLNNKISNLRAATPAQNSRNCAGKRISHLPRGVDINTRGGKPYLARINVGGKKISLGQFETVEEAAAAYIQAAKAHFGDYARC